MEIQVRAVKQEKKIKDIHTGKQKVKLSLFTNDIILYTENLKESTKKLSELVNEFRKAG